MAVPHVPYAGPIVTRDQAKGAGEKRYYTGKLCLRGHLSTRMVSNGRCMACFYLLRKPANERKLLTARIWWQKWAAANKELRRAQKRARYAKNAARIQAQNEAGRKKAPEASRAKVRNYRAKKRAASGRHSVADIADIMTRQNGKCAYCGKSLKKQFDVDHIQPMVLGGSNDRSNLQLTCRACNRSKSGADPIDFARRIGRLL